jgi:hypothetical protein
MLNQSKLKRKRLNRATASRSFAFLALITAIIPCFLTVKANEWSGNIASQTRLYSETGSRQQDTSQFSVGGEFEYVYQWDDSSITVAPRFRLDSEDVERNQFDLTELYFNHYTEAVEWRIGIKKVFWGVAESQHLVDIINQTDVADSFDGETKLGQPMINASFERDWGIIDAYVMPYFRERTFPGADGRLGLGYPVDEKAIYESNAKEHHVDLALRYAHSMGDFDFGVSIFDGTSREPLFNPVFDGAQLASLQAFYPQISQVGVDIQATLGAWLWKLEAIQRAGFGEDYLAAVGGFEYSFYSIADSDTDLGLIAEYQYDQRDIIQPLGLPITDKTVVGTRVALNDVQATDVLLVYIHEKQSDLGIFNLEFNRRIGNDWKLSLNASYFANKVESIQESPVYLIQNDSYLELNLAYYF